MPSSINRRWFLACAGVATLPAGWTVVQQKESEQNGKTSPALGGTPDEKVVKVVADLRVEKGGVIADHLVQELVYYAHSDLDKVKALVGAEPRIVNCAMDWGGGDYETALGAAAHMGFRDMAIFLLDHNARLDLFAATMLGKIDIVKAAVAAFPDIVNVLGPHGIPLIAHAEKGGDQAKPVLEYLQTVQRER